MNMWQAIYNGKKLGRLRTEKEKIRVEPYYSGLLWVVVPEKTADLEIREVRG